MKHINLETFSNGELSHQINRELEAVANNIADPNTDATAVRKITVTIAFKANEQRDFVTAGVVTKSTLAPKLGAVTALAVGKDIKSGKVQVAEIGHQLPGQLSLGDMEETRNLTEVDGKTVDTETGEILQPGNNVVDLRAVREA